MDERNMPDGVRVLLARAERKRALAVEQRRALGERRAAGLRRRHAAKLARQG